MTKGLRLSAYTTTLHMPEIKANKVSEAVYALSTQPRPSVAWRPESRPVSSECRCNPPDVVQGQPTPMPSQTGLTPRTHPNGRRFWYLEMASSKIVIGNFFPTVLLRGQIIFVLVLTSSISIVQDQKHRQISMQKSTRVFRLRPPTRTRHRRVKHAKSDLRPNEWWQSAVQ